MSMLSEENFDCFAVVTDTPDTAETVGGLADDPDQTSLLKAPDKTEEEESLLRQRQPYAAS